MAKQSKHIAKKEDEKKYGWNVWKIVAIAIIAVFAVILIGGLVKLYYFKSSFSPITQEQQALINKAINQDLMSKGDAIDNYAENMPNKIRMMDDNDKKRAEIPVFLQNSTTRHLYMMDANSGEIISHTVTTDYISTCDNKIKEGGREYQKEGFHMMGMMPCRHFR
jgi:uncharacterized protein YpmB